MTYHKFQHPFTCIVAGSTQSGKTTLTLKLIEHSTTLIYPSPTHISWCYGQYNQAQIEKLKQIVPSGINIEFIHGLPLDHDFDPSANNLVILDDLMLEGGSSERVSQFFTRRSHHENMSVIMLIQNLFHQSKHMRTLMLNSKYLIVFKNPRDKSQIQHLAKQISPQNSSYVIDAYHQATSRPYGYLLFDFDQSTPDSHRLLSGVLPNELPIRYIPKT